MLLGIDVGGTFTDAVIIDEGRIITWSKQRTTKDNLMCGIEAALQQVTANIDVKAIERVTLSTTVVTNTVVEHKEDIVDLYIVPGPGMNVDNAFPVDPIYVHGYTDHRGIVVESYDAEALKGVCHTHRYAAVSAKFANRNPLEEIQIAELLDASYDFVSRGAALSGALNFPRRTISAYFNSAVVGVLKEFKDAVIHALQQIGIEAPIYILKADGGSLSLDGALQKPVETIFTGPAATVLGLYAFQSIHEGHTVALDIGGTTTDISLWRNGVPLMTKGGVYIREYPSAVRSFAVTSIGIGGESVVRCVDGHITVGPDRVGPSMALGGSEPTLGDALIVLGKAQYGDAAAAFRGIENLDISIEVVEMAERILHVALEHIKKGIDGVVALENKRPIYVVDDIVHQHLFLPSQLVVVGGSASSLAPSIGDYLGLLVKVPDGAAVTNAIGAAVAKETMEITVRVDTKRRLLVVPELGIREQGCSLRHIEAVEQKAKDILTTFAMEHNILDGIHSSIHSAFHRESMENHEIQIEIINIEDFPVVEGWQSVERIMTVQAQLHVGVTQYVES